MLLSCSHIADGRASSGILLEFGPLDQLFLGKTHAAQYAAVLKSRERRGFLSIPRQTHTSLGGV